MKKSMDSLKWMPVKCLSMLATMGAAMVCLNSSAQTLPPNLISRWVGEGNIQDSVGTNNGSLNTSIGYVPGIAGQAFRIWGGIIQAPNSASLNPSNVTVQAWVKGATQPGFRYVLNKADGAGGISYAIYTADNGGAAFFVHMTDGAGFLLSPVATPSQVWDGNWHQLTGVFDGTTARLFVDGVEVGAGTTAGAPHGIVYSNPQPLILGDYQVARGLPYVGDLDEVKIFNRALTGTEIADTFANLGSNAGNENLVAWYKGENNTLDSKGTNNGTASVAPFEFAPGRFDQGFFAKGGLAYIPDSASLNPANLTVQTWVKSVSPPNFRYLLAKSRGAGNPSYALYTAEGGGVAFYVSLGSGAFVLSPIAPAQIWDGSWHLVTASYDGSFVRLYVDGIEVGAGTAVPDATGIAYSSPKELIFADYQAAGGLPFLGQMDDVQLYSRALTQSEIKSYYAGGNLISWWRAEWNADDSIGSNNGLLTGSTTFVNGRLMGRSFDTTLGTVEIPDAASLQVSNVTLEAMVSANAPGANKSLISKSATVSASSYEFSTGPDGGLVFSVKLSGGGVTQSPSAPASIWTGEFHHIAGTYDGLTVRLYVDGKEVGTGTSGTGIIQYDTAQNSGNLVFGSFPGVLDEIKLYSAALTGTQIDQNAFKAFLIRTQPVGGSFAAGTNVRLNVAGIQGPLPRTFQWIFNGTNIPGANANNYTITNLQNSKTGNYQVSVAGGGMRYTNGISGNSFDVGKGGTVRVANKPDFGAQQFSIQMWARATAPGTFKYLLSKSRDPAFYSSSYGFSTAGDGGFTFFVVLTAPPSSPGSFGFVTASVGTNIWDGGWHQFTGTWDGQFVNLYVDGVLAQSTDSFGGTVDYQTNYLDGDLLFGDVFLPSSVYHFLGNLDEVRFYNAVLNSDDVAATYPNTQNTVLTNNLVSWWKADNNTFDSAGNRDGRAEPPYGIALSDVATITIAASPATVNNPATSNGNFIATVNGTSGQSYIVQRSINLTDWSPIVTNTAPFTFTNTISAGAAYYRAVSQP